MKRIAALEARFAEQAEPPLEVEEPIVIPFPTKAARAKATGTDGATTKKTQRKRRANGKKPSKQFEQAVMMTFLVDEILKVGGTPTRERVQKHLYFAEEVCKLELGAEFMRKAAAQPVPQSGLPTLRSRMSPPFGRSRRKRR